MPKKRIDHLISAEVSNFLIDCQARKLSMRTVEFYKYQLAGFQNSLHSTEIKYMEQITTNTLRTHLEAYGVTHGAGGVHSIWRVLKCFLRWYEREMDGDYDNPIRKVAAPKVVIQPIPGIPEADFKALIKTCDVSTEFGLRDKIIFMLLLDTGIRAAEFCSLNVGDLDMESGIVHVRIGKGGKGRYAFLGAKTRREMIRYFRQRGEVKPDSPLWVNKFGERLKIDGLRQIIRRHAITAGLKEIPSAHDFRRTFATMMHRKIKSTIALRRLMGHSTTAVLERYIEDNDQDLHDDHNIGSPVDNL